MSLITTYNGCRAWLDADVTSGKTVGFVPTMGYLHEGHLSLIRAAKEENDIVVVSVFVNPTQFGPGEDYEKYPRDIERDYGLAVSAGADMVFSPELREIYDAEASTFVETNGRLSRKLCGISRPGHFRGVTTVVNILLNIVGPDRVYMGQKDMQQALIVKKMVRDLRMPVEVITCPIIREADGLAMSSRNVYLSKEERMQAICLNRGLQKAERYLKSGADNCTSVAALREIIKQEISREPLADIDYIEILDGETLEDIEVIESSRKALAAVAVRFGKTRLIDNRILAI